MPGGGDYFGIAVAIGGGLAVVGTENHDYNGSDSGAAYVFDVHSGTQLTKLLRSGGVENDHFGYAVAVEDRRVLVGAHLADVNGNQSGAAYLYDADTGEQLAELLPDDGGPPDNFGQCAAIHNGVAVIGAYFDTDNGVRSGSAYLFDLRICETDLTGDGRVNTRDVVAFLNAWAARDDSADWDQSGVVDSEDVIAFLNDWATGC